MPCGENHPKAMCLIHCNIPFPKEDLDHTCPKFSLDPYKLVACACSQQFRKLFRYNVIDPVKEYVG